MEDEPSIPIGVACHLPHLTDPFEHTRVRRRHTAATLLLGQGVHPKVVAQMLGHARISTTLDLYSHVTPTTQRQATEALDAVLSS